jgi:ElaB/YqjD/DUF883 family membrane-anchored ribosome-binding protein
MSDNGIPGSVKQARDEAMEIARKAYSKADTARKDAVKKLFETADQLREQAREVTGESRDQVNTVARNLERVASDLNSKTVDRVDMAATKIEDNVWKAILAIFFIGLLVGWWLGRD